MTTAVLCYHDIARPGERYSWQKMDVTLFEQQIIALKKFAEFIGPEEIWEQWHPSIGKLRLLITFDDGLINNYRLGFPVLKHHGIPALYFISTWHMENGEPFWFDRLIRKIQHLRLERLDLRHRGLNRYRFNPSGGEARWDGIQKLLEDIKRVDDDHEGELIPLILDELDCGRPCKYEDYEEDRPLNQDEIQAMKDSGICWFGSHSHHHRILTRLDNETLMKELNLSRQLLEKVIKGPVNHIAYPNGDVDGRVSEASRRAGYRFGFTVKAGKVNRNSDSMLIPRIMVGGFDTPWRLLLNLFITIVRPGITGAIRD